MAFDNAKNFLLDKWTKWYPRIDKLLMYALVGVLTVWACVIALFILSLVLSPDNTTYLLLANMLLTISFFSIAFIGSVGMGVNDRIGDYQRNELRREYEQQKLYEQRKEQVNWMEDGF